MEKLRINNILSIALLVILTLSFPLSASALDQETKEAHELTAKMSVSISDSQAAGYILDDNQNTYLSLPGAASVTISHPDGISKIYISWNKVPGNWSYIIDGISHTAGTEGFLHEYVSLSAAAHELIIIIPEGGAELTDIHVFGEGTLPEWVQIWEPPCEQADLMLLSTHSDDEQLFFAGILPYYAGEIGAAVQVVYMTNHWDTANRSHEQLNGLWTVGVRNYPIIGPFPDDAASLGKTSESVETVLQRALSVYDEEALTEFQVEMIRRFRPQVIVGHDVAGEYRHGAHIVNTYTLQKALELSADPSYYPNSAERYGVWDVLKTYLHLYEENTLVMDWDSPLKSFSGLSAFEVSKLGYACHLSQQWTWFTRWISPAKATDISTYSPCLYGLYRTMVGPDKIKNDFLENITTYREQFELAEIEQAEADRLAAEKAEAERLAAEEAENAERLAIEEDERIAAETAERAAELESARTRTLAVVLCFAVFVILIVILTVILLLRKKRRERSSL